MSQQLLIETMEQLLILHEQLQKTARSKTETLKNNDITSLAALLREEQKLATNIQIAEKKRERAVSALTNGRAEVTVSDLLQIIEGPVREKLSDLQVKLMQVLEDVKATNELNQRLIQYSLQFINLNLDLLAPEQELPNYSRTRQDGGDQAVPGRSIFDSKA